MNAIWKKCGATGQEFEDELIEVYRLNQDFDKATPLSEKLLQKDPNNPIVLTATAKLKADQGDRVFAANLLQKALVIWSDADESYTYFQEALAFKEELGE